MGKYFPLYWRSPCSVIWVLRALCPVDALQDLQGMAEGVAISFDSGWGLCLQLHHGLPSPSGFPANKPDVWAGDTSAVWMNVFLICLNCRLVFQRQLNCLFIQDFWYLAGVFRRLKHPGCATAVQREEPQGGRTTASSAPCLQEPGAQHLAILSFSSLQLAFVCLTPFT